MYYIKDASVYRTIDDIKIAPCQSVYESNYMDYLAWLEAGGVEDIRDDTIDQPVVILTMTQAQRMLYRAGYLDEVDAVILQLDRESQIRWKCEQFVHSDNELVNYVLCNILGLSEVEKYNLFLEAIKIV